MYLDQRDGDSSDDDAVTLGVLVIVDFLIWDVNGITVLNPAP